MTQANDSILVTPGSGATVATHLINSKEHQLVLLAGGAGHVYGSKDTYIAYTGNTAHVAAARTALLDIFNATGSGKIVEVVGIFIIPAQTAVAGIGQTYELVRTTAVGTGGTTLTPAGFDANNIAIPAQVTVRTKPTGGATAGTTLALVNGSSEETSPYAAMASQLNHVPMANVHGPNQNGIVIRENTGLRIDQTTNSSIGNVNVMVCFTLE
jgi:hypothetical protein